MDREEFLRKNSEVIAILDQRVWKEFKESYKPQIYTIVAPKVFGETTHEKISHYLDILSKQYEDNFSALITLAVREYKLECYRSSLYFKLCIESGVMLDNPHTRRMTSTEGEAVDIGHSYALYGHLSNTREKPKNYLEGTPFTEFPNTDDLLDAISLYWFNKAAVYYSRKNLDKCFAFLHEAYDARILSAGESMFYDGEKSAKDQRRSDAKRAAQERLRRDPRQKEKKFIRTCWQRWQDRPESYSSKAEFARDMLTKCTYLISNKKIEDWCREWEASTQQAK